jgi:hypothetical protein
MPLRKKAESSARPNAAAMLKIKLDIARKSSVEANKRSYVAAHE